MMEIFIEAVKRYPCLWQSTLPEYKDLDLKKSAWEDVIKDTSIKDVKEAKLRWKKLRDNHRDALKRQMHLNKEANIKYMWKYQMQMQFLLPYMSHRPQKCETASQNFSSPPKKVQSNSVNATLVDGHSSVDNSDSESAHAPKEKKRCNDRNNVLANFERKLDYLCKRQAMNHLPSIAPPLALPPLREERRYDSPLSCHADPLDVFFDSMCQSTKRLPYPTQLKIKRIVFNAVIEAEEAQNNFSAIWGTDADSSSSRQSNCADDEHDEKDTSFLFPQHKH